MRPLKELFLGGWSAEKTAQCLVLGSVLSLFPVLGTTSILCLLAAWRLRLNLPAIQAVNWLLAGVQLLLIIPFISAGHWLLGGVKCVMSRADLYALAGQGARTFAAVMATWMGQAVAGWVLIAVPLAVFAYWLILFLLRRYVCRITDFSG